MAVLHENGLGPTLMWPPRLTRTPWVPSTRISSGSPLSRPSRASEVEISRMIWSRAPEASDPTREAGTMASSTSEVTRRTSPGRADTASSATRAHTAAKTCSCSDSGRPRSNSKPSEAEGEAEAEGAGALSRGVDRGDLGGLSGSRGREREGGATVSGMS